MSRRRSHGASPRASASPTRLRIPRTPNELSMSARVREIMHPDKRPNMNVLDRFRGCLVGAAVGDSVGSAAQYVTPEEDGYIAYAMRVNDMEGCGAHDLQPGQWTENTSLTLCVAKSLIELGAFCAGDQVDRFFRWWKEGYMASTGRCFHIRESTKRALVRYGHEGVGADPTFGVWSGREHFLSVDDNGGLVRMAPIAMVFAFQPDEALAWTMQNSFLTQGREESVHACMYLTGLVLAALRGADKETLLGALYSPSTYWQRNMMCDRVCKVVAGSYKTANPPHIRAGVDVVSTLEAALWAFFHTSNFKDGLILLTNLGGDAAAAGCVYGQLAGAFYGLDGLAFGGGGVPLRWRDILYCYTEIEKIADKLCHLSLNRRACGEVLLDRMLEAAHKKDFARVRMYASSDVVNFFGADWQWAVLHMAAYYGDCELVRWLATHKGADLNLVTRCAKQYTALHIAAERGDIAMATTLIELGAVRTIEDAQGRTAYDAAPQGHPIKYAIHPFHWKEEDDAALSATKRVARMASHKLSRANMSLADQRAEQRDARRREARRRKAREAEEKQRRRTSFPKREHDWSREPFGRHALHDQFGSPHAPRRAHHPRKSK